MQLKFLALFLFVAQTYAAVPWVGEPRPDAWWMARHEGFLKQTMEHKSDLQVIFFGDSITEGWAGNGKDIWNKFYTPIHAYNYGISGDRTEHLVWRVEHKEFDGLMAKVVVLKIGTNNLGDNTEEDIAHGIKQVINVTLAKMPSTKVLLLGIIPRAGDLEKKVQAINTIISKYNDDKHVFYLDMSDKFQDSPGKEKAGLYVDTVHLTKEGYQVWYDTMEPLLKKLLMWTFVMI